MTCHPSRTTLTQSAKVNITIPVIGGIMESVWLSQYESSVANVSSHTHMHHCVYIGTEGHSVTI